MFTTTTTRLSPRASYDTFDFPTQSPHSQTRSHHSSATSSQPTTYGFTPPAAPPSTAPVTTPTAGGNRPTTPPGYFGLKIDPTESLHSINNWSPAGSSIRSTAAKSPRPVQIDNTSTPFQKQAEALASSFSLHHQPSILNPPEIGYASSSTDKSSIGPCSSASCSPSSHTQPSSAEMDHMWSDQTEKNSQNSKVQKKSLEALPPQYFNSPRMASPVGISNSSCNNKNTTTPVAAPAAAYASNASFPNLMMERRKSHGRSSTLPNPKKEGDPALVSASYLAELMDNRNSSTLLLDVRTYKLYTQSRIKAAVNLCVPTTLLKRPSFNVTKLSETFAKDEDKEKFSKWKEMKYIVVYDGDSQDIKATSAISAIHTLGKFVSEGWKGQAYVLKGGFSDFAAAYADKIDRKPLVGTTSPRSLSLGGLFSTPSKVTGGVFNCPLPNQKSVVNPFFSNIRQNMDLIGGVGEIPVTLPRDMSSETVASLPDWLKKAACDDGGSKRVANIFYNLEKTEQQRMQEALNVSVTYDSPTSTKVKPHALAGVEKGAKNRYNNIWPYDHARVILQDFPSDQCDYINASHISSHNSPKRYIASQAPLPSTFRDFWSMVWEQDVRVILMLTAEQEGGQVKSHNYWDATNYGPLKLTGLRESRVSLEPFPLKTSPKRRSTGTNSNSNSNNSSIDPDVPFVTVRKFTLEHTAHPFSPMREITQLQYSSWPDFGAPQHPAHILGLIEHMDAVVRASQSSSTAQFSSEGHPKRRPVLVHCSAGCGRTGTLATIDTVLEMLRHQKLHRKHIQEDGGGSDGEGSTRLKKMGLEENDWLSKDDQDLIAQVVGDFRHQRLSMVQSLRQFVLCYETVLEWLARQSPTDSGKRKA